MDGVHGVHFADELTSVVFPHRSQRLISGSVSKEWEA